MDYTSLTIAEQNLIEYLRLHNISPETVQKAVEGIKKLPLQKVTVAKSKNG